MNFSWTLLHFGICFWSAVASGQVVPESEYYLDDLGFLDVAMDRGENARLCDQLLRVAFLANIVLVALALITWGVYGSVLSICTTKLQRPFSGLSPISRSGESKTCS